MIIRFLLKIPFFFITLFSYMGTSFLCDLLIKDSVKKRECFTKVTSKFCGWGLRILGISINVCGKDILDSGGHKLQIANHMSYLDIMILATINPTLFITSVELQHTFFLGAVARLGGSLFVERRSKAKLLEEIERIGSTINDGFTVTLFPEGTSSNGERVLPFKGALFLTAQQSSVEIQPICIKYLSIDGKQVTPSNRDLIYYYGDLTFFPHIFKLLFVKSVEVEVTFLDPIKSNGIERKELVELTYSTISRKFES